MFNFFTLIGCQLAVTAHFFNTIFFIDLFFTVKLLRCSFKKFTEMLIMALSLNRWKKKFYVNLFAVKYLKLHRQLQQFNVFSSTFYLYMDACVKLASVIVFAIFLSHSETVKSTNSSFLSHALQKLLHFIAITVPYLALNVSMLYLAFFPTQNSKIYKLYNKVTMFYFTTLITKTRVNCVQQCNQNVLVIKQTLKTNEILCAKLYDLKFGLKIDAMVAFLSSRNNKMSFSYASFFPITKLCTAENFVANLYLMILVYMQLENKI